MILRLGPIPAGAGEALALLHRACFPDDPWPADALHRVLLLPGSFGFCAWVGQDLAGFVLARDLGGECEILSLGILPERRREGVGRTLVQAVLDAAPGRESASVVLEVAVDNAPARVLYASLGFVAVGHRPRYYRRLHGRADALILRRSVIAG